MLFQMMNRHNDKTSSFFEDEEDRWASDGSYYRIRKLHLRAGQNLVTWTVTNNRELTTLADIIYVPKIEIFGKKIIKKELMHQNFGTTEGRIILRFDFFWLRLNFRVIKTT